MDLHFHMLLCELNCRRASVVHPWILFSMPHVKSQILRLVHSICALFCVIPFIKRKNWEPAVALVAHVLSLDPAKIVKLPTIAFDVFLRDVFGGPKSYVYKTFCEFVSILIRNGYIRSEDSFISLSLNLKHTPSHLKMETSIEQVTIEILLCTTSFQPRPKVFYSFNACCVHLRCTFITSNDLDFIRRLIWA